MCNLRKYVPLKRTNPSSSASNQQLVWSTREAKNRRKPPGTVTERHIFNTLASKSTAVAAFKAAVGFKNQWEVFKSALRSRLFDLARVLNDDLYRVPLPRGELESLCGLSFDRFADLFGVRSFPFYRLYKLGDSDGFRRRWSLCVVSACAADVREEVHLRSRRTIQKLGDALVAPTDCQRHPYAMV